MEDERDSGGRYGSRAAASAAGKCRASRTFCCCGGAAAADDIVGGRLMFLRFGWGVCLEIMVVSFFANGGGVGWKDRRRCVC